MVEYCTTKPEACGLTPLELTFLLLEIFRYSFSKAFGAMIGKFARLYSNSNARNQCLDYCWLCVRGFGTLVTVTNTRTYLVTITAKSSVPDW